MLDNLTVTNKTLKEIKAAVGGTLLADEEAFVMSDADIKDYVIAPALETFLTYFPIVKELTVPMSGGPELKSINAPEGTLGVLRQQFIPNSSSVNNLSDPMQSGIFFGNPFASSFNVLSVGSGVGVASRGTPYDYGAASYMYQNRFMQKSIEASNKAYYIRYDEKDNKLTLKTSIAGYFYIRFALVDQDVDYCLGTRRRQTFIRYAQGLLKTRYADIFELSRTELPNSFDADTLRSKGEEAMEKELEYWRESAQVAGMC